MLTSYHEMGQGVAFIGAKFEADHLAQSTLTFPSNWISFVFYKGADPG